MNWRAKQDDFERRSRLVAHLLNDMLLGLFGILILLIAIVGVMLWSAGYPEVSAFLPEWLAPTPASLVTLPEGVER